MSHCYFVYNRYNNVIVNLYSTTRKITSQNDSTLSCVISQYYRWVANSLPQQSVCWLYTPGQGGGPSDSNIFQIPNAGQLSILSSIKRFHIKCLDTNIRTYLLTHIHTDTNIHKCIHSNIDMHTGAHLNGFLVPTPKWIRSCWESLKMHKNIICS